MAGRKRTVSDAQMLEACALVAARGDAVTVAQVRETLGGGATDRISEAVREWRENHCDGRLAYASIPEDLQRLVESAIGRIAINIGTYAQKDAQVQIDEISQLRRAAERELAESEQRNVDVSSKLSSEKARVAALEDRVLALERELAASEARTAEIADERDRAQHRADVAATEFRTAIEQISHQFGQQELSRNGTKV